MISGEVNNEIVDIGAGTGVNVLSKSQRGL